MSAWVSLPNGDSIAIKAGYRYAIVALLKNSHDSAFVSSHLAAKGLTVNSFQDPAAAAPSLSTPAESGYRYIALDVTAMKDAGTIPWSLPSPLSLFDDSTMLSAYAEPASAGLPPGSLLGIARGGSGWKWVLGIGGLGALSWWWLRKHKHAR